MGRQDLIGPDLDPRQLRWAEVGLEQDERGLLTRPGERRDLWTSFDRIAVGRSRRLLRSTRQRGHDPRCRVERRWYADQVHAKLLGEEEGDRAGYGAAILGDVSGDGLSDIAA